MLSRLNQRQLLQLLKRSSIGQISSATVITSPSRLFSSSAPTTSSPTSFSHDKIETDERYASTAQVPESLLKDNVDSEFSIRGKFREGRAAYLDMSATTPMDPRVFDKMAPYMVSFLFRFSFILLFYNISISHIFILLVS